MATLFRLIFIGYCTATFSCSGPVKKTRQEDEPRVNSSKPSITAGIDTVGTKKFASYNSVPNYIKKYLDSLSGEKFLIAEPGESFSKGCSQFPGVPGKQMIWAAINDDSFKMQYLQGGIALFNCLLTINLKKGKITGHKIEYM
jgi:hypothetical protein